LRSARCVEVVVSSNICPNCAETSLVEISLTVGGHKVMLSSCSACESRWWHKDGQTSEVTEVLELASQGKR
jgi:DNA polymerase III alpha subunit (gram-positive type)